jgi:hypothetical protein
MTKKRKNKPDLTLRNARSYNVRIAALEKQVRDMVKVLVSHKKAIEALRK